jgi:hypothetical protein
MTLGNILRLQDDSPKVTFLNCLTGFPGERLFVSRRSFSDKEAIQIQVIMPTPP